MAAISLFWYTNMAAVTSDENDLYQALVKNGLDFGLEISTVIVVQSVIHYKQ
jgi:hypothetical protein